MTFGEAGIEQFGDLIFNVVGIRFDNDEVIRYWQLLPESVRNDFEKLGIGDTSTQDAASRFLQANCKPNVKIKNIPLDELSKHIKTLIETYNALTGNKQQDKSTLISNIKGITLICNLDYKSIKLDEFDLITYRFASGSYGETYPLTLSVFCRFMDKYVDERNTKLAKEDKQQNLALPEHKEERKPIDELVKNNPRLKGIADRLNAFVERDFDF